MAIVESMNAHAVDSAMHTATVLPLGLTPFSGILLLVAAALSVRAFVQPRPFEPATLPKPARQPSTRKVGAADTVPILSGGASPHPANAGSQSARMLHGAFTALLDEVYVCNPDTFTVTFMNARAENRARQAGGDLSSVQFADLLPERNRQGLIEAARNLRRSCLDSMVFELTADGTPIELTLKLIRDPGEDEYFMAIMRDLTSRVDEARAQADYVATLSHEMRTPLTSIKGAVDLIASGKMGELSGGAQTTLGVAQRNVERLLRLTNDILDLEKMDAGQMRCDFENLSVHDLARDAAQEISGYARQFDVAVTVESAAEDSQILGDRTRLLQVLANLLSNAIKYSAAGGDVLIRIEDAGQDIRISVVDAGPGIPDDLQETLFEPYHQGPQVQRKVASSGLGLSIAKRIVEAHSGEIGFDTVLGQGTVFYFDIPRRDASEEVAA